MFIDTKTYPNSAPNVSVLKRVLRHNKDSLMAILEAFAYDPLLTWKLTQTTPNTATAGGIAGASVTTVEPQQQPAAAGATDGGLDLAEVPQGGGDDMAAAAADGIRYGDCISFVGDKCC